MGNSKKIVVRSDCGIMRAVVSLCLGPGTRIGKGSELSEEFLVPIGLHRRSVLSPLLFAIPVGAIAKNAWKGLMNEILYANNLF